MGPWRKGNLVRIGLFGLFGASLSACSSVLVPGEGTTQQGIGIVELVRDDELADLEEGYLIAVPASRADLVESSFQLCSGANCVEAFAERSRDDERWSATGALLAFFSLGENGGSIALSMAAGEPHLQATAKHCSSLYISPLQPYRVDFFGPTEVGEVRITNPSAAQKCELRVCSARYINGKWLAQGCARSIVGSRESSYTSRGWPLDCRGSVRVRTYAYFEGSNVRKLGIEKQLSCQ